MLSTAQKRESEDSIDYSLRLYHKKLSLRIDRQRCIHCDLCSLLCPREAIWVEADEEGLEVYLDENRCILCEVCSYFCPTEAIHLSFADADKDLLHGSEALPVISPGVELNPERCPLRCETVSEFEKHWCRQQREIIENRDEACPKYCFHCLETCPREVFSEHDGQVTAEVSDCLRCTTCLSRCEHGSIHINPLFTGKVLLDPDRCPDDCDKCFQVCPINMFERRDGRVTLTKETCALCGACINVCDRDALVLKRDEVRLPESGYCKLWDRLRLSLLSGERVAPGYAEG